LQQSKYLPKDKAKFDQVLDDLTSPEQGAADARSLAVNAYIQICNQNYRLAIKLYNRIESSGCSSIMVLNNRAFTYIALGRFKEAQDDLNEAVRLDPNCQAVRYNRAFLAFRMRLRGKIKAICPQSLDDVELALRLGPTTSALYRDAALLYSQAASDDQREARLEQALLYLRQAIAAGEPPTNFRLSPFLSHSLKQPTFASLTEAPPREVTRRPELRLIDPVDMVD
jgi:tetratricopeptide (TPR) repeat protein